MFEIQTLTKTEQPKCTKGFDTSINVWFNFMFFYQSTVDSTHDKRASVSLYECPTHPIAKVTSFFGRKPYRSDLVGSPNITYFVFVYLKI